MSDLTLTAEQIEQAASTGIVTRDQIAALRALATAPSAASGAVPRDDEHFQFLNGFNDIFLTIGVLLLSVAIPMVGPFGLSNFFLLAVVAWGLSEILVAKHRAVLPGIALASVFCLSIWFGIAGSLGTWGRIGPRPLSPMLLVFGAPVLAALAYYARFRLPFALLLLALSAAALVIVVAGIATEILGGPPLAAVRYYAARSFTIPALISGIAIFATAMWFDLSDPQRRTARSDNGFWLHLAAAPLIVHPLIAPMLNAPADPATGQLLAVVAAVVGLGLAALTIDRRALLVSSLFYLLLALGYLLKQWSLTGGPVSTPLWFGAPLLLVGAMVLMLGLWWHPLRRALLTRLPLQHLIAKLPPLLP